MNQAATAEEPLAPMQKLIEGAKNLRDAGVEADGISKWRFNKAKASSLLHVRLRRTSIDLKYGDSPRTRGWHIGFGGKHSSGPREIRNSETFCKWLEIDRNSGKMLRLHPGVNALRQEVPLSRRGPHWPRSSVTDRLSKRGLQLLRWVRKAILIACVLSRAMRMQGEKQAPGFPFEVM